MRSLTSTRRVVVVVVDLEEVVSKPSPPLLVLPLRVLDLQDRVPSEVPVLVLLRWIESWSNSRSRRTIFLAPPALAVLATSPALTTLVAFEPSFSFVSSEGTSDGDVASSSSEYSESLCASSSSLTSPW